MLKRSLHIAWLLFAAGLFVLAVLLTVARVWAPSLGDYRHDIESAAAAALQRPVSIGRIEATWRGLHPVFRLTNVVVAGTVPAQSLGVREIHVGIDTIHFLRTRELRFAGIDIIGASITLARAPDGRLMLEEFSQAQNKTGDVGFGALAAMSRLSVRDADVTIRDIPQGAGTQHFTAVNVTLVNTDYDHYVTGHALLPGQLGDRIEIVAHLRGDIDQPADWRGRAYFKGQSLTLSSLLAPVLESAHTVQGIADLRLWAELTASRITAVTGELEIDALRMTHATGDRQSAFAAERLQTQFGWRQAGQGWEAVLQRLQATRAGQDWQTGHLVLAGMPVAEGMQVRAAAERVDLAEIAGLLPVIPGLDAGLRDTLVSAQPAGLIEDLNCTLTRIDDSVRVDAIRARFTGLGMLQTGALPYLSGLNGSIHGVARGGTVQLRSDALVLHDEHLFRSALQFDRADAKVYWHTTDTALEIGSDALVLGNPHLALDARFSLALPRDGGPMTTDTAITVREFDIAHTGDYLPARIMAPTGVAWLDHSLKGGRVRDGSVIIQGPLAHLPFDHGEGRFEVRLPVSDATLDYNEHWSPITQLDAQVDFTGRRMDILAHRGFIRTAALQTVTARIPDLARPRLAIEGEVQGALPVMLAELDASPLGATYGGFIDHITAGGRAELALDIGVPLDHSNDPITAAGRIGLRDNTLRVNGTDVVLEGIGGRLTFDEHGIHGDDLHATLFGHEGRGRVWTEPDRPVTHIALAGRLGLLDRLLAADAPLRSAFSGEPDWHVELTTKGKLARGKTVGIDLNITSTLAGMAIDLPAPFGKTADAERPLQVEIAGLERSERYVRAEYSDALQAVLVLTSGAEGMTLQRANIALGGETPVPPQIPQLLVSGRLDRFRLADWQRYLAATGGAPSGPPLRLSLRVAELDVFGQRLRDTGIDMVGSATGWTIKSLGPSAEGEVRLIRHDGAIDEVALDMQRLALEPVGDGPGAAEPPQPATFPLLQIKARQFVYDKVDFGALELRTRRQSGGDYRIERLSLASKLLSVQLVGDWRQQGRDQVSHAEIEIRDGNVGALLDALGYQKLMKGGRPSGRLKASWRGAPWEVKAEVIDGRFEAIVKDGQLLEVEPGATGRALGLLSLTKLPRRLTLDFTDLFGEGFSFDRIAGDFVLDSGNAYTENMVIDGPAAKIDIAGRVGLAAQDYDELVTVTPYLNSGLPLAGALAGGPAVGAAVIVAEKLLEDKLRLNELARKRYEVTGPWANPVVKQLNAPAQADSPATHFDDDSFFE